VERETAIQIAASVVEKELGRKFEFSFAEQAKGMWVVLFKPDPQHLNIAPTGPIVEVNPKTGQGSLLIQL